VQALNGNIQQTVVDTPTGADTLTYYSGTPCGNDQYVQFTITKWVPGNGQNVSHILRSNNGEGNQYEFSIVDNLDQRFTYLQADANGSSIIWASLIPNIQVGDVFLSAVVGSQLYWYRNGILLFTAKDTSWGTGVPALGMTVYANLTDVAVSPLIVGNTSGTDTKAYSVPDCRGVENYEDVVYNGVPSPPNLTVNVQGTDFYTVALTSNQNSPSNQVCSNQSLPPVDSRVSGPPKDCRVSKPLNSRTPGKFGPGQN
jgi:hypothetical protein